MSAAIINIRIPSQNRTVKVPRFLSRLVFCLNHYQLYTKSVELEGSTVIINMKDYGKFIKWLNNLNNKSKNNSTYNLFKNQVKMSVILPDFGSGDPLGITLTFHKSKTKALDKAIFQLLRI